MTPVSDIDAQKRRAFDLARAGKLAEAEAVLRTILAEAPQDLGALLLAGDVLHAGGQPGEAGRLYRFAIDRAEADPAAAAAYPAGLARARQRLGSYVSDHGDFIDALLPPPGRSPRFDASVDILLGRKRIYLQQPTRYYFPGLPQIEVYPRSAFPWAAALEAKTQVIREELLRVMAEDMAFEPYLPADDGRQHLRSHRLVGNPDWSAFFLWKDGARVEANCARCPATAAAIEKVPLDHLPGQAPSVLFSLLKPGAHIPPHTGFVNTRLICHLPLLVPGPAWLRVGNTVHHWKEGELIIFDDSIEHEAKNESDGTRVVLLFDVWRPELTAQEQREIATLLGAISTRMGAPLASTG